jgi:polysaccharide pyruvyl transferase WcaK-like protein
MSTAPIPAAAPLAGSSARPAVRVGLLWHSPNSGNLGVGALTVANIALIDAAAERAGVEVHYTILGFVDPGAPTYVVHPRLTVAALNGRAFLPGGSFGRALRHCDLVIDIGGGDSFADIYGPKRFTYLLLTKVLARLRGVPLVLAPQTIGPFTRQPYRALATAIMKSADLVVARDPLSFDAARGMSAKIRLLQAVDVAFALPYDTSPARSSGPVRVGVNVSGLLFNRGYSGANEFGMELDYPVFTRSLIERLLTEPDVEVWLVSHVNSEVLPMDDDGAVAATLQREYPATRLAPRFTSPSDAKSFIAGLDFLVAGRMHACIAAYSAGVPVVPVAYSRKFSGLFTALLGYEHMLPVRGVQTEPALAFTLARFRDRATLRGDIAKGTETVRELLEVYRRFLADKLSALRRT